MPERVLVIDDSRRIVSMVSDGLEADGLHVDAATTGKEGLDLARQGLYDLVVLDVKLPDVDGTALLRDLLAARPDQRVVVLSTNVDIDSTVRFLELGAVDYLQKPFTLDELRARVKARLREPERGGRDRVLRVRRVTLDLIEHAADIGAGPVPLSEREFLLLEHLMRRAGEVCSREELLNDVWGYTFDPGTNVVDVYVRRLRTKLGREVIQTVRQVGYTFPLDQRS
jgi:DNA-binding response OmpR family regulator